MIRLSSPEHYKKSQWEKYYCDHSTLSIWKLKKGNSLSQSSEARTQIQAVVPKPIFFTSGLSIMTGEGRMFQWSDEPSIGIRLGMDQTPNTTSTQDNRREAWLDDKWTKKLKLSNCIMLCEERICWQKEACYICLLSIKRSQKEKHNQCVTITIQGRDCSGLDPEVLWKLVCQADASRPDWEHFTPELITPTPHQRHAGLLQEEWNLPQETKARSWWVSIPGAIKSIWHMLSHLIISTTLWSIIISKLRYT